MADPPAALSVRGLTKRYGTVAALDDVSLAVAPGSLHALVGANGSGKSTLIRIVAGVEVGEAGSIAVGERSVSARAVDAGFAREAGVRVVHQVSTAFGDLSVAENIGVAAGLPTRLGGSVDWRRLRAQAGALLERLRLDVDPRARMADLSPARQTLVTVARAFADADEGQPHLLVLDEPTAALPAREVGTLLAGLRQLVDGGHAVVLVTHRLDEVGRAADEATVLRDGRRVSTFVVGSVEAAEVVEMVTGAPPAVTSATAASTDGVELLRVDGLSAGPLEGIDLAVRHGEIVAVAGLLGSGRSTLLEALFGARRRRAGELVLDGDRYAPRSPADAIAAGVALVPEQRAQATFAGQSVADNLSILDPGSRGRWWRDRRGERRDAERDLEELAIVAAGPDATMTSLSGGNQQKVVLARWLRQRPRLLLLDEPTLGVDVGARAAIHELIRGHVADGCAALVVSSDTEELCALADRILVLHRGRLTHELAAAEATPAALNQLVHQEAAA
jgi:ribose transport system ATP-binding protein